MTATTFAGSGANLTDINVFKTIAISGSPNIEADSLTDTLTLVAGSNMTITQNPASDTITFASSGGGSGITVQDEGSSLSTSGTTLNFVGSGVVASGTGATKTITISGGGGTTDVGITTNLSGSFTASAGSASNINSYTYNTNDIVIEYTVFIKNGSNYQSQKVLAMRDGTTVHYNEFAIMYSSSLLATMDVVISGGAVILRVTPETGVSGTTTYRLKREVM